MGSRRTGEGHEKVYAAGRQWVERALREEGSLFTPGKEIWSIQWLEEIRDRFLNRPDESGGSFYEKMKMQLAGSPPEVFQLMSEVLYIHFLIVWEGAMKGSTKKRRIVEMLRWSKEQIPIPDDLTAGLTPGIANPGTAFNTFRPFQVGFLLEFAENWKKQTPQEQERLLQDPWAFKDFLWFTPTSGLLRIHDGDGTYRTQREALLHLIFPNTFEGIVSATHKRLIVQEFKHLIKVETGDIDRELQKIRLKMEDELGRGFNYYDDDIRIKWDPYRRRTAWDDFVGAAQKFLTLYDLNKEQIGYKIDIANRLSKVRRGVLDGVDNWNDLLEEAFRDTHSIIFYRLRREFLDWVKASPGLGLKSLQGIWVQHASPLSDRIRSFNKLLPQSVIGGTGTRTNVASALLMGLDAEQFPPFNIRLFNDAYDLTGYHHAAKSADEADLYEHALTFLDLFIKEASERGLEIDHRLAAQSLVWVIVKKEPPLLNGSPGGVGVNPTGTLFHLAEELLLPVSFLEEIEILLKGKGQIIFQGPPGTGKTYVAKKLAEHLAGSKERVTLVQFHSSYAYEDFVQGYRPALLEGQPGFELKDGPLLQAAHRAIEDPDEDHFLVIDEINRGNLAKVFGELYFLLEYRKEVMRLQYQADREFSLPKNLYIIGTMNTADRSIALVDLALRRRFYFVDFHPDDEPIKGLLRNWLLEKASNIEWVADVIDLVNGKLEDDRHVAIGPSYFMGTDETGNAVARDEVSVRRIWKHSVLPYIEEHLFGNLDGMDEWDLDKLMQQVKAKTQASVGEEGSTNTDASD